VVDEIVMVDTGSTDESVAIAQSFGARVLYREWDGDFSAARNYGLDHMASRWILYIDADEYLAPVPIACCSGPGWGSSRTGSTGSGAIAPTSDSGA